MGYYFIDKYSLLHFSVGILWNYAGLDLISLIVLHILFEIVENTKIGMKFINNYFTIWPGGKEHADSFINSTTDVLFSILGWLFYKNYFGKIGKNELVIITVSNILFYWMSNFQIMIFLLFAIIILIGLQKLKFIIFIMIGLILGYMVTFIDNKLELFR